MTAEEPTARPPATPPSTTSAPQASSETQDSSTPQSQSAQAQTTKGLSLRLKFLFALLVIGLAPTVFLALLTVSQYQSLIADAFAGSVPEWVAERELQLQIAVGVFLLVTVVLVGAGVYFGERLLVGPIRRLLAWLRKARANKFVDTEPAPNQYASDELGELSTEMNDAVVYFQEVRDREEALLKEKSEFISIAAHQLRTPLTGLRWGLESMLGAGGTPDKKAIDSLQGTTQHMINLVNDLLDAAKLEEGKFGFEFGKTDIVSIVKKVIAESELAAKERSVTLSFSPPSEPIPTAYADKSRIELALSNFISNAINYTKSGGTVKVTVEEEGRGKVRVAVTDTGIGIREEDKKRIFTKFFRSEDAVRMRPNGSGLGLYIVKNIIERHGGEVGVESEAGKGSTFSFVIPTKKSGIPELSVEDFLGASKSD